MDLLDQYDKKKIIKSGNLAFSLKVIQILTIYAYLQSENKQKLYFLMQAEKRYFINHFHYNAFLL